MKMMDPSPNTRISADEILNNYLPSEQELEIKSQKMMITNMKKELEGLRKQLKIERKRSF